MFFKVDVVNRFRLEEISQLAHVSSGRSGIVLSLIDDGCPNEMGFICRYEDGRFPPCWAVNNYGANFTAGICFKYKDIIMTAEQFIEMIRAEFPQDIDIFLFHPEIFHGRFNR